MLNTPLNHFMGGVGLLKIVLFIHGRQENISYLQLLIILVKITVHYLVKCSNQSLQNCRKYVIL